MHSVTDIHGRRHVAFVQDKTALIVQHNKRGDKLFRLPHSSPYGCPFTAIYFHLSGRVLLLLFLSDVPVLKWQREACDLWAGLGRLSDV